MFNLRTRKRVIAYAMAISSLFLTPEAAIGLTIECGARGGSFRVLDSTDPTMTLILDANDLVQWQVVQGVGEIQIDIGDGFFRAGDPGSFVAPVKATSVTVKVAGATAKTAVSCTKNEGTAPDLTALWIGAVSQTNATNIGVGLNSKNRFLSGKNFVSKNKIFVSTSNMDSGRYLPPDWNAWLTLEGRSYSGGIEGNSFDLVGGVDRLVTSDLLIGVLGGYGKTFLSDGGTPENSTSPMLGAYFGSRLSESLILDGFLSMSKPVYGTSGAVFSSTRMSAGVTLTGRVQTSTLTIEPFLLARGYQENQPTYMTGGGGVVAANQTSTLSASLGVRIKFEGADTNKRLVPYVSAAADYKRATSSLSGLDVLQSPRFAVGVQGALGKGTIRVDIDFGKVRSDTFDRGVKLGYELKF